MLKEIGLTGLKKEYGLIAGAIILLLLCYQLAFKKTIEAFAINRDLKSKVAENSNLDYQPDYLNRKSKNLDDILSKYHLDSLNLRNNSIATLASIAQRSNVKLAGLPNQDPQYSTNQYILQKVEFEGDYFSLLKLINNLQTATGVGIPRSIVWKSVTKNPGQGETKKLTMEVYFEVSK